MISEDNGQLDRCNQATRRPQVRPVGAGSTHMLLTDLLLMGDAASMLLAGFRKSIGLAKLDMRILLLLHEHRSGGLSAIRTPSGMSKRLISGETGLVNRLRALEDRQLVARLAAVPGTDGRRSYYGLTRRGHEVAADLVRCVRRIDAVLLVLTSKQAEAGIARLAEILEAANTEGLLEDPSRLASAIPEKFRPGRQRYAPFAFPPKRE